MSLKGGSWFAGVLAAGALGSGVARADDVKACIAANDAGLELRKSGHLRDALKVLATCADPTCPDEVRVLCNARIAEFTTSLPALLVDVTDEHGAALGGATITLDGTAAPELAVGATPLDPGEHRLRVEAAGRVSIDRVITLRVGEKGRREAFTLRPPPWWNTQRILGMTSLGIGLAGFVTGAIFTGFAASAKSQQASDAVVMPPNAAQVQADYNAAVANATGADVGFIVGGVFAAAGVVLLATARTATPPPVVGNLKLAPWLSQGRGLLLQGSF